jgi:hypothetical protein
VINQIAFWRLLSLMVLIEKVRAGANRDQQKDLMVDMSLAFCNCLNLSLGRN